MQIILWLLWLGPFVMILTGMGDMVDMFQLSVFIFMSFQHCNHIAVRHATIPDSCYNRFYTEEIPKEKLAEDYFLSGGILLTPETVDRELHKAYAHSNVTRALVTKIKLFAF